MKKGFDIRAVHHLALVCEDIACTVDVYRNVLGSRMRREAQQSR